MRAVYRWTLLIVALSATLFVSGAVAEDATQTIETCGIQANRLPPLFVPDRYDLELNLTNSTQSLTFTGKVSIRAKYTDTLSRTHKVTFKELLKKICKRVVGCGIDPNLAKRQILLNVGRALEVGSVQVVRGAVPEGATAGDEQDYLETDDICVDRANQIMAITLAQRLTKDDEVTIRVTYRGHVSNDGKTRGFYQTRNRGTPSGPKDFRRRRAAGVH